MVWIIMMLIFLGENLSLWWEREWVRFRDIFLKFLGSMLGISLGRCCLMVWKSLFVVLLEMGLMLSLGSFLMEVLSLFLVMVRVIFFLFLNLLRRFWRCGVILFFMRFEIFLRVEVVLLNLVNFLYLILL